MGRDVSHFKLKEGAASQVPANGTRYSSIDNGPFQISLKSNINFRKGIYLTSPEYQLTERAVFPKGGGSAVF
jgi:hypothetical protein